MARRKDDVKFFFWGSGDSQWSRQVPSGPPALPPGEAPAGLGSSRQRVRLKLATSTQRFEVTSELLVFFSSAEFASS